MAQKGGYFFGFFGNKICPKNIQKSVNLVTLEASPIRATLFQLKINECIRHEHLLMPIINSILRHLYRTNAARPFIVSCCC